MRVVNVHGWNCEAIKRHVRTWVPSSAPAEMICSALTQDIGVKQKVIVDERGVAAAVSYMNYPASTHVFSLGSLVKGGGTLLMHHVELLAKRRGVPVTLNATATSEGFYRARGYVRNGSLSSLIPMILKEH